MAEGVFVVDKGNFVWEVAEKSGLSTGLARGKISGFAREALWDSIEFAYNNLVHDKYVPVPGTNLYQNTTTQEEYEQFAEEAVARIRRILEAYDG